MRARTTRLRGTLSVIGGVVLILVSLGLLGAGGAAVWVQTSWRHGAYVDLDSDTYRTDGYALVSGTLLDDEVGGSWDSVAWLVGDGRIRVTATDGTMPIFVGIATRDEVDGYLSGVEHATVRDVGGQAAYTTQPGTAPAVPPADAEPWIASASGSGAQELVWPGPGEWTLVAMNADTSRSVAVQVDLAATLPSLPWVASGLVLLGLAGLAGGITLVVVPARRARTR